MKFCKDKIAFVTKKSANRYVEKRQRKHHGKYMRAYKCNRCPFFHLTKRRQENEPDTKRKYIRDNKILFDRFGECA